jgi:DNA polymerase III subunit beta
MQFIISTSVLSKNLKAVSGVLNSNNTLAILDCFLFEINNGELLITASDMENTVITKTKVDSNENGSIAIPARLLSDTLNNFPEQPLTFTVDEKTFGIKIITDNGEYKLAGQNAEEYPRIPKLESAASLSIQADVLINAISKTIFATGNDDLRPVMSGVFVQFGEENTTFVATDAHKLVRYKREDAKSSETASIILPKKPLNLLKNLLAGQDSAVTMEFNAVNASFTFGTVSLVCRLIDGKYPNYDAVIPKENPNKLIVDRDVLLGALKRVGIYSNKATHQIRLKISGSDLQISAEDVDFANEAKERMTCNYTGNDMEIGFNSKFLMEMVSNLNCDEVMIEMSMPNRAGILTPVQKETMSEDVLMLVMPVMLNS